MYKKLTITLDAHVYRGLHKCIGRGKISRFISDLVRPLVTKPDIDSAYRDMAADEKRETEALEWSEGLIGDEHDQAR